MSPLCNGSLATITWSSSFSLLSPRSKKLWDKWADLPSSSFKKDRAEWKVEIAGNVAPMAPVADGFPDWPFHLIGGLGEVSREAMALLCVTSSPAALGRRVSLVSRLSAVRELLPAGGAHVDRFNPADYQLNIVEYRWISVCNQP